MKSIRRIQRPLFIQSASAPKHHCHPLSLPVSLPMSLPVSPTCVVSPESISYEEIDSILSETVEYFDRYLSEIRLVSDLVSMMAARPLSSADQPDHSFESFDGTQTTTPPGECSENAVLLSALSNG